MKLVTFQAAAAYLITESPDWDSAVELAADLPGHLESGLTAIETRRPLAGNLRLSLTWDAVVQDLPALRNATQAITTHKILCPLWPAWFAAGATPPVSTPYYVMMGDDAEPAIVAADSIPIDRPGYPLLVGKFAETPDLSLLTDEAGTVEFRFEENSADCYITPPVFAAPVGLAVGGSPVSLFPFRPNWATAPKGGAAERDIDAKVIGQGRETADAYYDQPSRRGVEDYFTLTESEPWQLLSFFLDCGGFAGAFWLPGGISDTRLTADVLAADTHLHVAIPTARGNNTAYVLDDLTTRRCVAVASNGSGQWNLSSVVGADFERTFTRIESLILSRFKSSKITLKFKSPQVATTTVSFRECPWELEVTTTETAGATMGRLAITAHLYTFSIAYPGETVYYRYTDFESDLTCAGNTWTVAPIEHGDVTQNCTMERQQSTLKARTFQGSPLNLFIPFRLEWPLMLKIEEVSVIGTAATVVDTVFYGEVTEVSTDGPYQTAKLKTLPAALGLKIPRKLFQPGCNWSLFDQGTAAFPSACGLSKADWEFAGTIVSYNPNTCALVVTVARVSGTPINSPLNWFAGGLMVTGGVGTVGNGPTGIRRRIASNTAGIPAADGNTHTLTLGAPLTSIPAAGDPVLIYPGCDGDFYTCKYKFNNLARFGGFYWIPAANPTFNQKDSGGSYGKK